LESNDTEEVSETGGDGYTLSALPKKYRKYLSQYGRVDTQE